MSSTLVNDLVELKRDEVLSAVKERMVNEDPMEILKECQEGMDTVGKLFEKGDYFLAELILSGEIFKEVASILDPFLTKSSEDHEPTGKIVLATLQGDLHDIGKNIFSILLKAQGFEIYDLGVDVPPHKVVTKVKEVQPDYVGFSALITSCFDAMKETVDEMDKDGLRDSVQVLIGGGVTNETTRKYVGADFQTTDAASGVKYCLKNLKGEL